MKKFCYITFPSTYHAIRAESLLKKGEHIIKMVPVPRSISTSCGTSLRCFPADKQEIISILKQNNVIIEGMHLL